MTDDDLRQREAAMFYKTRVRWLEEDEARERRRVLYRRFRWPIRIGIGVAIAVYLSGAAIIGWTIGTRL
jgi:hypothetical protein